MRATIFRGELRSWVRPGTPYFDDPNTNRDGADPDVPPSRRACSLSQIPLRAATASRRHKINKCASTTTEVVRIPSLVPQPLRTKNVDGMMKRRIRITRKKKEKKIRGNPTAIATRRRRLYCVPRRSGLCLPLWERLARNVSNVAAFHRRLLRKRKRRWMMSRTSAAIRLPNPTTSQTLF